MGDEKELPKPDGADILFGIMALMGVFTTGAIILAIILWVLGIRL